MENSFSCPKRFCADAHCLFCRFCWLCLWSYCGRFDRIVFFLVCANEKSFYLQESRIVMQMEDSWIVLLLGSGFDFTIILSKSKCQPPALRAERMCPVTIHSLTSGKMFCYCGKLLSQNTMTEDEIIHYERSRAACGRETRH